MDSSHSNSSQIDDLVKKELGQPTSESPNEDHTFTIYRIEEGQKTIHPRVKYLVVDNAAGTIIKKGFITMGYIKWLDNQTIVILDLPRVMPQGKSETDFKTIITVTENNKL